jgi:hypothetical protein
MVKRIFSSEKIECDNTDEVFKINNIMEQEGYFKTGEYIKNNKIILCYYKVMN